MPIVLPKGLPAAAELRAEGISVAETPLSATGHDRLADPRPLRIALLNLMPEKPRTELQIARMLGGAGLPVSLTLMLPDGYRARTTDPAHIERHYRRWSDLRHRAFDGLIVTGAPIEFLAYEEVSYWRQMTSIMDWSREMVGRSLFICWSAQAALKHRHGVEKRMLPSKAFGVYRQQVVAPSSPIMAGFPSAFPVPVSRHSDISQADLPEGRGLAVLARSSETGLCLLEDRPYRSLYMFNHLEYDADTLDREYRRDLAARRPIAPPVGAYPGGDLSRTPVNVWRAQARRFFSNWLRGMVFGRCRPSELVETHATRVGCGGVARSLGHPQRSWAA